MESKTTKNPKLKIILAIRSLNFGGAERQWILLAKELTKHKEIELHLCTLYGGGELESEIHTIPHTCLEKKGRGDFSFLLRYYKLIKTFNPDCIYAFMPEMNIFSLLCGKLQRNACKVIFGFRSSAINVSKLPFASKLYFYTQKFLSRYADAIICNSQDAINFYKSKGYFMKKAFVVHNGIDTKRFCPSDSSALRAELGIAQDCFVFGISARMHAVKDYPLLALVAKEFLESLGSKKDKVAFVSLGKSNLEILHTCTELLAPYSMKFLGAKNAMEHYYPLFDCIVSTSYTESFSNSIAEGMACGCVPIVSDVGESKVIANFNQDSYQFCFTPKDSKGALECLKSLYVLKNSAQFTKLKEQARAHIIKEFSPKNMTEKTLEILKKKL
ncbi:glycosyltransferase [Helicobacter turcicus]|uniref:Glycosyltransferase n=1 Tax=Helicobacter turcicus TaxID=2867412 RepID=A0ABS7JNU6_9HELI|nr:glycosyltransferase [Helicobacter turcicus]MBX7491084.1 glycosyltransferase [Helicobacter turcicus]MBX7545949.1 glycosyltransferase [Helicobacter turcicus]